MVELRHNSAAMAAYSISPRHGGNRIEHLRPRPLSAARLNRTRTLDSKWQTTGQLHTLEFR